MDVERVIFSVGQKGAVDAYERAFGLRLWAAHVVFFGDHLPATVFTSDTPKRLAKGHKAVIEQAVTAAASGRYVDELEPTYGSRVNRQLGAYFMNMAREAFRGAVPQLAAPAFISTEVVV